MSMPFREKVFLVLGGWPGPSVRGHLERRVAVHIVENPMLLWLALEVAFVRLDVTAEVLVVGLLTTTTTDLDGVGADCGGHLIEINVGLVVTPTGIEQVTDLGNFLVGLCHHLNVRQWNDATVSITELDRCTGLLAKNPSDLTEGADRIHLVVFLDRDNVGDD